MTPYYNLEGDDRSFTIVYSDELKPAAEIIDNCLHILRSALNKNDLGDALTALATLTIIVEARTKLKAKSAKARKHAITGRVLVSIAFRLPADK